MIDTGRTLASIAAAAEDRFEREIIATAIRPARMRVEELVKAKLIPQIRIFLDAVGQLAQPGVHRRFVRACLAGACLATPRITRYARIIVHALQAGAALTKTKPLTKLLNLILVQILKRPFADLIDRVDLFRPSFIEGQSRPVGSDLLRTVKSTASTYV